MHLISLVSLLMTMGCTGVEPPPEIDRSALTQVLTWPTPLPTPTRHIGTESRFETFTVVPMRLDIAEGLSVGAALWRPDKPTGAGVVVAHGHFGQARSAAETQQIAHQLALQGAVVVAIDSPGMEEHDRIDNEIHLDPSGAHGRGYLLAGGTNAMALQVALLRLGLDILEGEGATRLGATGASGGAVQSFYLALVDTRVRAVALAAFPPLPREARANGCPCDQVPGFPGPDAGVISLLKTPSIWMGDASTQRAPEGLPETATFVRTDSPHSYTQPMQQAAVDFFHGHLGLHGGDARASVPLLDLSVPPPPTAAEGLLSLSLPAPERWSPKLRDAVPFERSCSGTGSVVLVLGGDKADTTALVDAGMRACTVRVVEDPTELAEHIAVGDVYADVITSGVASAARSTKARAIYAVGPWAVPASVVDLPMVVRRPVRQPRDLQLETDPAWVHVPGMWWGIAEGVLAKALATSAAPAPLTDAIRQELATP